MMIKALIDYTEDLTHPTWTVHVWISMFGPNITQ